MFYLFKVDCNGLFLYTVRIQPLFYDHILKQRLDLDTYFLFM